MFKLVLPLALVAFLLTPGFLAADDDTTDNNLDSIIKKIGNETAADAKLLMNKSKNPFTITSVSSVILRLLLGYLSNKSGNCEMAKFWLAAAGVSNETAFQLKESMKNLTAMVKGDSSANWNSCIFSDQSAKFNANTTSDLESIFDVNTSNKCDYCNATACSDTINGWLSSNGMSDEQTYPENEVPTDNNAVIHMTAVHHMISLRETTVDGGKVEFNNQDGTTSSVDGIKVTGEINYSKTDTEETYMFSINNDYLLVLIEPYDTTDKGLNATIDKYVSCSAMKELLTCIEPVTNASVTMPKLDIRSYHKMSKYFIEMNPDKESTVKNATYEGLVEDKSVTITNHLNSHIKIVPNTNSTDAVSTDVCDKYEILKPFIAFYMCKVSPCPLLLGVVVVREFDSTESC